MMADRKRTSSFSFAALLNSEEKQNSAAHTSSYITWQCTKYNHSPSSFSPFPPPCSPCPLTVKRA